MNTSDESIMVIGFDIDFCYLMQRYVRMSHYQLVTAHQDDSVQEAHHAKPAAIIIEIGSLNTLGRKALHALKTDRDTCKIPIVGCCWQHDEAPFCIEEGASVCLTMPILYEHLRDALLSVGIEVSVT